MLGTIVAVLVPGHAPEFRITVMARKELPPGDYIGRLQAIKNNDPNTSFIYEILEKPEVIEVIDHD